MQTTREKRPCLGTQHYQDAENIFILWPLANTWWLHTLISYSLSHQVCETNGEIYLPAGICTWEPWLPDKPFSSLASQVRRGSLFHTDLSSKSSQWKPATNEQSSLWMAGSTIHLCIWSEDGYFNQGGYQGPCRAPYKQESAEGAVSLLCNSVVSAGPSLKLFANSGGGMKCAMS